MSPPLHRQSLPHSMTRVPTAPQAPTAQLEVQQTVPMTDVDRIAAVAKKMSESGAWTAEDLIQFGRLLSRDAVIQTRQDDRMRVEQAIGQARSETEMKLGRENSWLKLAVYALLGIASGVGIIAGTCQRAYDDFRSDQVVPVAAAEAKAIQAEATAVESSTVLHGRITSTELRLTATEAALLDIGETLKANTRAINQLSEKLDTDHGSVSRRKPR